MAKKLFIGVGHGGSDPGAVGYIREETVNLNIALACRNYLKDYDVEILLSRTKDEDDPLTEEIRECNRFITKRSQGMAVDIHNNAGGGDGFEAYYSVGGGDGKVLAKNIEKEIKLIGQNSRGVKTKANSSGSDYFGFIRQTIAPAVIVECVFVDNKKDAAQADTLAEQKVFGEAIAKGIVKTMGLKKKKSSFKVRVTGKNLKIRKGPGATHPVIGNITDKGTYTIVDVKGKWGLLKAGPYPGVSWINLGYTKEV